MQDETGQKKNQTTNHTLLRTWVEKKGHSQYIKK